MKARMERMAGCKCCCMVLLGAVILLPGGGVGADELGPTTRALLRVENQPGWNMGARVQVDRRQLMLDEQLLEIDGMRGAVRFGVRLLPFLHIWGEAGTVQADRIDADGSTGLAWGGGAGATLFEYVLRSSPVFGPQEVLGVELHAAYLSAESRQVLPRPGAPLDGVVAAPVATADGERIDLEWRDTRLMPLFVYRLNRLGDRIWRGYEPTGYVLRAGPVYARTTGTFADMALRERNDFGALFGADIRFSDGWVGQMAVSWFGASDREVSLGIQRYF